MSTIFNKLNLTDQREILVLNPPASFELELKKLKSVQVTRDLNSLPALRFMLAFVIQKEDIDHVAEQIKEKIEGDAIIWFAYPKKTAKSYVTHINRDKGWDSVEQLGFKGVRQVAIDETWSAIRFRLKEFVGASRKA